MGEWLGLNLAQWDLTIEAGQLLVLLIILWSLEKRRRRAGEVIRYDDETMGG